MYVSACIKFAVVSLAKASHMAKSMVKVGKQHWGHEYNESILDKAAVQVLQWMASCTRKGGWEEAVIRC